MTISTKQFHMALFAMSIFALSVFVALPLSSAIAADTATSTFSIQNPLCASGTTGCAFNSLGGLIGKFVEIFSYVVILLAVLAFIWVGFQFILARGNVEEMKKLKDWLLYIAIGVAVVIGARIMVNVIIDTLRATGVVNQSVINSAKSAVNNN